MPERDAVSRRFTEIAKTEGFTAPFITLNFNGALLSPALLTAIAEGRQPPHLTAKLLGQIALPDLWLEQPAALQFSQ